MFVNKISYQRLDPRIVLILVALVRRFHAIQDCFTPLKPLVME